MMDGWYDSNVAQDPGLPSLEETLLTEPCVMGHVIHISIVRRQSNLILVNGMTEKSKMWSDFPSSLPIKGAGSV